MALGPNLVICSNWVHWHCYRNSLCCFISRWLSFLYATLWNLRFADSPQKKQAAKWLICGFHPIFVRGCHVATLPRLKTATVPCFHPKPSVRLHWAKWGVQRHLELSKVAGHFQKKSNGPALMMIPSQSLTWNLKIIPDWKGNTFSMQSFMKESTFSTHRARAGVE